MSILEKILQNTLEMLFNTGNCRFYVRWSHHLTLIPFSCLEIILYAGRMEIISVQQREKSLLGNEKSPKWIAQSYWILAPFLPLTYFLTVVITSVPELLPLIYIMKIMKLAFWIQLWGWPGETEGDDRMYAPTDRRTIWWQVWDIGSEKLEGKKKKNWWEIKKIIKLKQIHLYIHIYVWVYLYLEMN
jgi:hypothetical protein